MSNISEHIRAVLAETIKIVFPLNIQPEAYIKNHVWRDKKYLGEVNGKVSVWKGLSANLNHIDFRYRAVFIDEVKNNLPLAEQIRLFGTDFVEVTANKADYIVMFVLDFPLDTIEVIKNEGFTPRLMNRVAHACRVCSVEEFLSMSALHWAAQLARLILLQRVLSIHRKPFEAYEVPLQNLLYRTGYLHAYFVEGGLELVSLSSPRKSGDFGHDLHAVVRNTAHLSDPFPVGVEVYMGAIGYHVNSIPSYVNTFDLSGMIVVAKDDPMIELQKVKTQFRKPIAKVSLSNMGGAGFIGIHHLSFDRIITDFDKFRGELDEIVPNLPTYFS